MQSDIDGILAKLKRTLNNSDSSIKKKESIKVDQLQERNFNDSNEDSLEIDLILKEKMLSFFNQELEKKFSDFFSNDEGQEFLTNGINTFFEKNKSLIENIVRAAISDRIKNIKL